MAVLIVKYANQKVAGGVVFNFVRKGNGLVLRLNGCLLGHAVVLKLL